MPSVTVLIPTYDHADTLLRSIASVQQQSIQDFELFVVGDGSPPRTVEIMREFRKQDKRIQYFHHEKGERHGEVYRHEAIQQANSNYICYLCDDDLWLPNHLAVMLKALNTSDFVHTIFSCIRASDGAVSAPAGNLSLWATRERLKLSRGNYFGPTCVGQRLDAYKRLPHGWRPAPDDVPTDTHMWRQWIDVPGIRFHTEHVATNLHFGSPQRVEMTMLERLQELDEWLPRLYEAGFEHWLIQQILYDWNKVAAPISVLMGEAKRLIESEEYQEAKKLSLLVLQQNEQHIGALSKLCLIHERIGDLGEALRYANMRVATDDENPSLYAALCRILIRVKSWDEAENNCRHAIALDPDIASLHKQLSVVLYNRDRRVEALVEAVEASRLDPSNIHITKWLQKVDGCSAS